HYARDVTEFLKRKAHLTKELSYKNSRHFTRYNSSSIYLLRVFFSGKPAKNHLNLADELISKWLVRIVQFIIQMNVVFLSVRYLQCIGEVHYRTALIICDFCEMEYTLSELRGVHFMYGGFNITNFLNTFFPSCYQFQYALFVENVHHLETLLRSIQSSPYTPRMSLWTTLSVFYTNDPTLFSLTLIALY
ncbi:hypothetical protein L9F63_006033, partial [Diploptera punctata]